MCVCVGRCACVYYLHSVYCKNEKYPYAFKRSSLLVEMNASEYERCYSKINASELTTVSMIL